jgi:hypothetical protein
VAPVCGAVSKVILYTFFVSAKLAAKSPSKVIWMAVEFEVKSVEVDVSFRSSTSVY